MNDTLVLMEEIEKSFPGVHALTQAQFNLRAGEVHALVGENGAGKSTLMKILSGIYSKDSGRILFKGEEVHIPNPRAAQNLGISMIHQELNLMPHLSVAQNIFIGREPRQWVNFMLNEKGINQQALRFLEMLHLDVNPRVKVSELTVAKQQMVEIAKALSFNSDVLIMDEPTAALTESEIDELFDIIRDLRAKGVGIVYISHRLEELKLISDRITVMRDSCYINTVSTEEATLDQIISMMVGRTIYEGVSEVPDNGDQPIALSVEHLNRGKDLKDITFQLKKGEIVGFAGLMGSGRTEVARAVFGADPIDSGDIYVRGKKVRIHHPSDAVAHGIGYLSEDRKRYGLTLGMDVATNIVLASFNRFLGALGIVKQDAVRSTAKDAVEMMSIRTPSIQQKVKNLSGGNQQKIVIAKWLTADTDILIFDEPTRGIDVGAKSEIYRLLNDLARQGKAIIMISSELPEILRMSHRVIVMCEGRISGELDIADATQEKIMYLATLREAIVRTGVAPSTAQ